jgi:PEGA domain-containing protein
MTTPETRSVELEEFAPSCDAHALENDENMITEDDIRELSAYGFDSDDQTLAGIGISGAASSSAAYFDSSDQTLVGIGPLERAARAERAKVAERAKLAVFAELASRPGELEATPDSARMPHSEPPGPFVAADDDEAPPRLPMQKLAPWVVVPTAVLIAAAAVAQIRAAHHRTALRLDTPARVAPRPVAAAPPISYAPLESVAPPMLIAASEKLPEAPPPPRAIKKSDGTGPMLGALDIASSANSSLVLDGRPLGKAPHVVQLPPGPHTVVFVHPERGRMSVTVNVRPGQTTVASADF